MFKKDFTKYGLDDNGVKVEISASRRAFLMGNALVVGVIDKIGRELAKRIKKMKYELHSYRHALDIVESAADLKELWNEVESCLKSISDDDIINNFMNRGLKRGKYLNLLTN